MTIEHDNIIYMSDIAELGGTSTFVYEMVKKYCNKDIAVVYKSADIYQLARIRKYCRTYKLGKEDKIKCKVCIINYDTSELEQIENGAKIYMVIHADYTNTAYEIYPNWKDPRITKIIFITETLRNKMKDAFGIDGIVSYNPLDIEENKRLKLVSATRLSHIKGKERMIALAKALDEQKIDYVWYIFTDDTNAIANPNIIYLKPRLDVIKWIQEADYVVQLSDTEALSYTINETLYSNVPVIVTPLPYLEEIGVKDNENAYILSFNCDNVKEVAEKMKNVPKFKFKRLEDKYEDILAKGERREAQMVKVKCIYEGGYDDIELGRHVNENEEITVEENRAEVLTGSNIYGTKFCEVIEEVKPKRTTRKKKEL